MTLLEVRDLVDNMPFNRLLGIRVIRLHSDGVTIQCRMRDDLRNSAEVLHGGVTASMTDAAVGIGLARHFGGRRPMTTVELKISYLRPIHSGNFTARSHLLRVGSNLCVGRVDVFDSARKVAATALVTYILLERE